MTAQPGKTPRSVLVIGRQPQPQEVLDAVSDAGEYDVVIVEPLERAYAKVKQVTPSLIVLCLLFDDLEAFHVLSMLKLDDATSTIPLVTFETVCERPAAWMH